VGYCSKSLLRLNPYKDKLAKKIGVYWTLQAVVGATHATFSTAKVATILVRGIVDKPFPVGLKFLQYELGLSTFTGNG
jgi:hypothetical protein